VIYGRAAIVNRRARASVAPCAEEARPPVLVPRGSPSKVVNDRRHFRPLTRAGTTRLLRADVYVIRRPLSSNLGDAGGGPCAPSSTSPAATTRGDRSANVIATRRRRRDLEIAMEVKTACSRRSPLKTAAATADNERRNPRLRSFRAPLVLANDKVTDKNIRIFREGERRRGGERERNRFTYYSNFGSPSRETSIADTILYFARSEFRQSSRSPLIKAAKWVSAGWKCYKRGG